MNAIRHFIIGVAFGSAFIAAWVLATIVQGVF